MNPLIGVRRSTVTEETNERHGDTGPMQYVAATQLRHEGPLESPGPKPPRYARNGPISLHVETMPIEIVMTHQPMFVSH